MVITGMTGQVCQVRCLTMRDLIHMIIVIAYKTSFTVISRFAQLDLLRLRIDLETFKK